MASGRKFGWKNAGAALGGGLAGAGVLLGLGKLGAPPAITSSILGGMGLVGVGVTRGPMQTAIASSIGSSTVVMLGSALRKGRERAEARQPGRQLADRGGKPRRTRDNPMEGVTLEAFDHMRSALGVDEEERALM